MIRIERSCLSLACLLSTLGFDVHAQTAVNRASGEVVVTGQAASQSKSIRAEEQADILVNVISADEIGALPDQNVAESLARLPGVVLLRDQGEGRYVSIRGMGPELNGLTINGALMPSPEAGQRGVALDALPSGVISSITVQKMFTADQATSALGGVAEVKTLTAFDLPAQFRSLHLQSTRDGLTGQSAPGVRILFSDRLMDGKFGYTFAFNRDRRKFGSDNVETGGAWDGGSLESLELRDYLLTRERTALSLNLDYKPDARSHIYLRGLNTQIKDTEARDRYTIEWLDSEGETSAIRPGQSAYAEAQRRVKFRSETLKISSLQLGTRQDLGRWMIDGSIGQSKASEATPLNLDDARFTGFGGQVSFSNTQQPRISGPSALSSPASYKLNRITLSESDMLDTERFLKFDATHRMVMFDRNAEFSFGTRLANRIKSSQANDYRSKAKGQSMADFLSAPIPYEFANFGPGLQATSLFNLGKSAGYSLEEDASAESDSRIEERIRAFYVQSRLEWSSKTNVLLGLRQESTKLKAIGNSIDLDAETITSLTKSRDRSDLLPSLSIRSELAARTTLRAGLSRSMVRAGFNQLAPSTIVEDNKALRGNPDLKPLRSNNIDLSLQHLLGRTGAITVSAYRKSIQDFTYLSNLGEAEGYDELLTYRNGDRGKISGLELGIAHRFTDLPAPWNRFLVSANASISQGSASLSAVDDGTTTKRNVRFPGHAERSSNLVIGYEYAGLSARLAYQQRSNYLLELTEDFLANEKDLFVAPSRHLDFSMHYRLTPQFSLGLEATNLTNQAYYVYQNSKAFNAQYERYGRGLKMMLRAAF